MLVNRIETHETKLRLKFQYVSAQFIELFVSEIPSHFYVNYRFTIQWIRKNFHTLLFIFCRNIVFETCDR